jgi:hypothetical protein
MNTLGEPRLSCKFAPFQNMESPVSFAKTYTALATRQQSFLRVRNLLFPGKTQSNSIQAASSNAFQLEKSSAQTYFSGA